MDMASPITKKDDAVRRNVPEVDAWQERVRNPPPPDPVRDNFAAAHILETLQEIQVVGEEKIQKQETREARRKSLERWTDETLGPLQKSPIIGKKLRIGNSSTSASSPSRHGQPQQMVKPGFLQSNTSSTGVPRSHDPFLAGGPSVSNVNTATGSSSQPGAGKKINDHVGNVIDSVEFLQDHDRVATGHSSNKVTPSATPPLQESRTASKNSTTQSSNVVKDDHSRRRSKTTASKDSATGSATGKNKTKSRKSRTSRGSRDSRASGDDEDEDFAPAGVDNLLFRDDTNLEQLDADHPFLDRNIKVGDSVVIHQRTIDSSPSGSEDLNTEELGSEDHAEVGGPHDYANAATRGPKQKVMFVPGAKEEHAGVGSFRKAAMRVRDSVVNLPVFAKVAQMRRNRMQKEETKDHIGVVQDWRELNTSKKDHKSKPAVDVRDLHMHEKNTNPLSDFVSWVGGVFSSSSSKHQLQYDEDGNPVVFGQNGALQAGETQVQQNPVTGSWSFKKHAEELFGKKKKKKKRRRAKLLMPRLNAIAGSNKQKQMMRKTLSDTDIYSNLNNHKENDNWSESSEDEEDSDNSSAQSVKLKKKMIKVLVKQQDNAKTHPHYKVYKCTCYSCTVWAAFASFFLIFGGILYFTSILPSLRFIYNEYGTAERIEAQFVHFLEQSSFDVVEVLNQAVQQGLYKEPLHFQHLDWLLTPLLQQRRAGVNRLELGFLGTRKPVTEHGIIFRKTGPLGHFILQSDMYPSCVSIGAFGCVPDMKIPQRSWYQRLTKISFENLYLIYPLDLLTMKVSPENFEMSKQSIVKMNEWDWFRYVLAKQDINETSMVSNNEIRIDEWKLAYEECHAAAASGDFCDAGGNPLVAVFNNPLNAIIGARASASGQSGSGGSTSATGVSSATVSASASSNSTAIMISSASTSSTSTLTTTAPAPLQVLNTTPTSTTTITLTIPSFPNVVDGCFTAYQITDNYLYFHFKHDRSEHLYVIDPPESCYRSDSGQSRGINWEEQTIARQRAYLQGRKWQRRIYFEWNQDGPDFVSTSGTQIDLSGDAFKFSPAMGLTFKLEFPDAPLDPNLQNLNLAEMQVTHIIGRISVDLTGCSSFMRDPFVDEYLGAESSAAQVREDFEAFIVDKGGRIVCARSLDDQVRKVDNSGKNTQLQFKKIWELAHFKDDLGLSPTSWALTVAKLDTIPTLPPLSGGMVGVRSKVDQFELPNYANEYETTTSASSSAELDHEDANLGPLGWGSPFVIRRIRHSRMAGFYVVTRMTTAPFSSTASGIAAVFMTLVILGGSPFVLCCSIVGLFAIRDVAIYKKETQRQRALLEAKATLEAVAAATGGGGTAGRNLNQTEVDDAKMIEAAA